MRRKIGIGFAILLVLALFGSLVDSEETTTPSESPAAAASSEPPASASVAPSMEPSPSTAPSVQASAATRCEPAPQAIVDAITSGMTAHGGSTLAGSQAVQSQENDQLWFVAGNINAPGDDEAGPVGVWVTTDLNNKGMIASVNHLAQEFSNYPDAGKTALGATMASDGAKEAEKCVG